MTIYVDHISMALNLPPLEEEMISHIEDGIHTSNGCGIFNSFYGKKHTDDTRKTYSLQRMGDKNPMYGRSIVNERNLKWFTDGTNNVYCSEGEQPIGYHRGRTMTKRKPASTETKAKISKSNSGKVAINRLSVVSPSGLVFDSIKLAANHLGLTVSQFRYRYVDNGDWIIQR